MNNDSEKMSSRSSQTGSSKKDHVSHAKKANITSAIRTLTWKMAKYFLSRY